MQSTDMAQEILKRADGLVCPKMWLIMEMTELVKAASK